MKRRTKSLTAALLALTLLASLLLPLSAWAAPADEEIVLRAARECGKIITCEEHSIVGGLGEAVCSLLSEKCPTPVRRIGVNDVFGYSGPAWDLLKAFGLSAEHIVEVAKSF